MICPVQIRPDTSFFRSQVTTAIPDMVSEPQLLHTLDPLGYAWDVAGPPCLHCGPDLGPEAPRPQHTNAANYPRSPSLQPATLSHKYPKLRVCCFGCLGGGGCSKSVQVILNGIEYRSTHSTDFHDSEIASPETSHDLRSEQEPLRMTPMYRCMLTRFLRACRHAAEVSKQMQTVTWAHGQV